MKKLHEFAGTATALLVGNPTASAINAPQGKKYDAFKDAYGNVLVDREIGGTVGALGGAAAGYGAGALLAKSKKGQKAAAKLAGSGALGDRLANYKLIKAGAKPVGALAGALGGLVVGSTAGILHGHYGKRAQEIRNRHLSANLKPALRELAARSERIVEFAMVRDANGRYVEVEDEDGGGMGAGKMIKAGAGAAAIGAGGLGAYRLNKAVMDKYGSRGLIENMESSKLPAAYAKTSAAGTAAATRGQAYRAALKDVGNFATSRMSQGLAAGKAAYNAAGKAANSALPVEGSGFGAKLLRGLRKGLKVATRM